MEVGPRRAVANLPQALDESVEPWRRVPFSRREFVRRDEERRHLAFRFEERKQSRGCNGTPSGRLKVAHDRRVSERTEPQGADGSSVRSGCVDETTGVDPDQDRKSTRLNSSHLVISYAVFCLKKKKKQLK